MSISGNNVSMATLLAVAFAVSPADAATDKTAAGSNRFDSLLSCRVIEDALTRLACYDRETLAASTAREKGEVVVLSRDELKQARRSLFGFVLPNFSLRGLRMDQPDTDRLETTVRSVRSMGYHWSISLADEAGTWETTEYIDVQPHAGDKVKIKKGLMGGYLGTIGSSNLVRMRRVQ